MVHAPHIRRLATTLLITAVVVVGTCAGMAVALLAASTTQERTTFGTLETRVVPTLHGSVTVYVPLVDWRVRLLRHHAPARVEVTVRGIDRSRATEGVSSSAEAARSLADVRADSERVVAGAIHRGVIVAAIGGGIGALVVGGALAGATLHRRWWLLAPLLGSLVAGGVLAPSVSILRELSQQHVQVSAAGGNAGELPSVLRFAEQLLTVGDEYEGHFRTALTSARNLATFTDAGAGRAEPTVDTTALVVSDLHDNVFVLDALDAFAGDDTVFAVGDFVLVGAAVERSTAPDVANLGGRVIAVSGNHDTTRYMRLLADAGATVLDQDERTWRWNHLLVAGFPDPLESFDGSDGHRLRVYGDEYRRQRESFLAWFDELPDRPDVVLVHQHGFAHALADALAERGDTRPLLILSGHDHDPHVHATGAVTIVDSGTVGAGGLAAVGEQDASFARLNLARGRIVSVDEIAVDPLTARASTKHRRLAVPVGS